MAASRTEAASLVAAGRVLVSGAVAEKTARQVGAAEPLLVEGPPPRFASRGGEKLDAALSYFAISVDGCTAFDAGASTGGFTDCLLQRGASRVVAVDVGHGQLLPRLRTDARVEVHERVNVRNLGPEDFGGRRFDLVVADLSFISLGTVAAALVGLARDGGGVIALVKPQFEAGRKVVSRGKGVVVDPGVRAKALLDVAQAFHAAGASVLGAMPSPIRGAEGNVEFLLHACATGTRPGDGLDAAASLSLRRVGEEQWSWRR